MTWRSTRYDHHPRFLDEQKDQGSVLPCDESLCVSKTSFDSSFSCYAGNVTEFKDDGNDAMCADGYIPKNLDEEPISYFTCCPPMQSSYDNIERHCSDVITLSKNTEDDTNDTAKCVNANQPYLRPMKNSTSLSHESFLCCDSEIDNTIDFLNITECNDSMQPYLRMMKTNIVTDSEWHLGVPPSIQSYVCCDTTIDDYNDNGTAHFLNSTVLIFNTVPTREKF